MLKLADSGCAQHPPRHITLKGPAAALVGRLVLNLLPNAAGHSYICEHGHTHCLTLQRREESMATAKSRVGLTRNQSLSQ